MLEESLPPTAVMQPARVAAAARVGRPGKAQKQFNELITRIAAQRRALAEWQAFVSTYHQIVAESVEPLAARLRERRVALVKLLDRAVTGGELTRREQAKAQDILLDHLWSLLREATNRDPDPELVHLHDAHSNVTFQDLQERDAEAAPAVAALRSDDRADDEAFVVDAEATGATAEATEGEAPAGMPAGRKRRSGKSGNETAESASRAANHPWAAQNAGHAMREVYRKLASELHPDRERDPGEQARKTVLMQQANQAYAARDLVGLLELQLQIEQIEPVALTDMARERLAHFNHVLREQSQRLQQELAEATAPFRIAMGGSSQRRLTPDGVRQALHSDIRELRLALKELDADIADFRDVRRLKAALKTYRGSR